MAEHFAKRLKAYKPEDLRTLKTAVEYIDDPVQKLMLGAKIDEFEEELQRKQPQPQPQPHPQQPQQLQQLQQPQLLQPELDPLADEEWRASTLMNCQVSSDGRVKLNGHLVPERKRSNQGYRRVYHCGKYHKISRLVCRAFHGPSPVNRPIAMHKNHIRHDDRACNLVWANHSEVGKKRTDN